MVNQCCHAIALSHAALMPGGLHCGSRCEQLSSLSNGLLALLQIGQQGVQLLASLGEGVPQNRTSSAASGAGIPAGWGAGAGA